MQGWAGRLFNINTNIQAHGLEVMRKIELMHASKANDEANEDVQTGVRKESSTTATQESISCIGTKKTENNVMITYLWITD